MKTRLAFLTLIIIAVIVYEAKYAHNGPQTLSEQPCSAMTNLTQKSDCYLHLAETTNNTSAALCDNIALAEIKQKCIEEIQKRTT